MKNTLLAVAGCALAIAAQAHADKLTPQEELFLKTMAAGRSVKGGSVIPHWMEDGNSFWWFDGAIFWKFDPVAAKRSELFDAGRLRAALKAATGKDTAFSDFAFQPGEKAIRFTVGDASYEMALNTYELKKLPQPSAEDATRKTPRVMHRGLLAFQPPSMEQTSPDGHWLVGTKDGNLYLRSADRDETDALTQDGTPENCWEIDTVEWSPDSKSLLAAKIDQSKVPHYPIVHWLKPNPEIEDVRLPNPTGMPTAEEYHIDIATKKRQRIEGENLQTRGRNAGEILMTSVGLQAMDFIAFNPSTGKTRILFTDKTDTILELGALLPNSPNYMPVGDGKRFLWLSERGGWNEIYVYGFDGKLIRQLTSNQRPVVRVVGVDASAGWVYYTAHGGEGGPYATQLYRVSLEGGTPAKLTDSPGQHEGSIYLGALGVPGIEGIQMSPSKQFFLDSHSDIDAPLQTDVRRVDGTFVEVLAKADATPIQNLRPIAPEQFSAKAADGKTDIFGVLYKPADFDPSKKYPVLESIYAGPQVTQVARTYAGPTSWTPQAYANAGYVVFVLDARGTPGRGKAFQDVVYKNFGRNEIPDHAVALKEVAATRPYMDLDRVGVFGTSFGGYFAMRALLQAPDTYKVAVANAPATDLRDLQPGLQFYMGPPSENKEAYDYALNVLMASKLEGRLLIIHGTSDLNAPFVGTIRMIDALIQAGKRYDLILLPEQDHSFGQERPYASLAALRYFEEHLKPNR